MYRNLQANRETLPAYLGKSYYEGAKLGQSFADCGALYRPDCTVWQITDTHEIALVSRGKAELITADYIIIATGAIERPMPVRGWTLPGVMSVGGAQTLLKQAALGADDAVFVGSGPLLYLTVWQYIKAGLAVRAVIDITGAEQWRSAIPFAPLALLQPDMLAMGRKWLRDIRQNTEVIKHVSAVEITGQSQAQGVSCTLSSGGKIDIDSNHIFLHQGVVPNVNLTMATGLDHQWDHQAHCWRPVTDVTGKSSDE